MQSITNLDEAEDYLTIFYKNIREEYTLDRMRKLMAFLGNSQDRLKIIHVAGTSGKTSTAYYVSALLTATGSKVGLTVSPHLERLNERVQINGSPMPADKFCAGLTKFSKLVEKSKIKPSWFELMVAFAFWYFDADGVDYAVIEVGLGGLKDGTNVIDRKDKICLITDIGFDHIEILGNNLTEIAFQKAGIIQESNVVFCYKQADEIMSAINKVCDEKNAVLHIVDEIENKQAMPNYQLRNWVLAAQAFEFITARDRLPRLSDSLISDTQRVIIPGRMDVVNLNGKTVILDGAHNVQKMTAMVQSYKKMYPDKKAAVLLSLKKGKDYQEIGSVLLPIISRAITTSFETSQDMPIQSTDPVLVAESLSAAGLINVSSVNNQEKAIKELLNGPEEICLITGSIYFLGQLRKKHLI